MKLPAVQPTIINDESLFNELKNKLLTLIYVIINDNKKAISLHKAENKKLRKFSVLRKIKKIFLHMIGGIIQNVIKKQLEKTSTLDINKERSVKDLCNLFFFLLGIYQNDNIYKVYNLSIENKKSIYYVSKECGMSIRTSERYKQKILEFMAQVNKNYDTIIKKLTNILKNTI